jgi:hypothetical protein
LQEQHEDLQQQHKKSSCSSYKRPNARHGHRDTREPFPEREKSERERGRVEEEEKIFPFCLNLKFIFFEKVGNLGNSVFFFS